MTESEWMTCTDPTPMLEFLQGKASDRKLRLFAVNCCRQVWDLLPDKRSRDAVGFAEHVAEGRASEQMRDSCYLVLQSETDYTPEQDGNGLSLACVAEALRPEPLWAAEATAAYSQLAQVAHLSFADAMPAERSVKSIQARFLRCIFGNPFRLVTLNPACLTPTVINLAQNIYDEQRFADLPMVADALDEAGCTHGDSLNHCRSEGPHVRGCWVVDLLLGKH